MVPSDLIFYMSFQVGINSEPSVDKLKYMLATSATRRTRHPELRLLAAPRRLPLNLRETDAERPWMALAYAH
jgi:hypothetical protein